MKAILKLTTNFLFSLTFFASAMASQPNESGAGKICGVLKTFEGEIQIFDYTRTHLGDAAFGTKLHCGDWISVEKGKATLEHVAGAGILVAENTFLQILDPQAGDNSEHAHLALYRGEFLAQAAGPEIRILTPNAIGRVEKGGAFLVYSAATEESQIVGMGGTASLENRFFSEPRMSAGFAKVVTFANPVERLVPDQARFVNARDLGERLARIGVPESVREALDKAVKVGVKTKMPVTLAVTAKAESRAGMKLAAGGEFSSSEAESHANRSPAGGAVAPQKKTVKMNRKIASDEPNFMLKNQIQSESEKKKLLQALSSMRADDEGL